MNPSTLLDDQSLAEVLEQIASVMEDTIAMPKAAQAVREASRRLGHPEHKEAA